MAFSKAPLFDAETYQQSIWSKANAHPARIIILKFLLTNGLTSFKTLCTKIPLAPETVSQHLRTLRLCGLIVAEERCPHTYYQLNHEACKVLAKKMKYHIKSFL